MASSSSLLCQFLLISATAIGTLLMILPDANALECYVSRTKNASAVSAGGCATWELNKMLTIATGNDENPLTVSIGNGTPTMDCGDFPFCVTLHCARAFGDYTVKGCAKNAETQDPTIICQKFREYCAGDPKFYCRLCNTKKCNDD